jgi:hypothetical protein
MSDRSARFLALGFAVSALAVFSAALGAAASADATPPTSPPPNGTVQVTNADTGAPVLGAHIRFFRQDDGRTVAQLVTDRDGVASMRLESGEYRYVVTKSGFQQVKGAISYDSKAAAVWTINILLAPGITPIGEDLSLCSDLLNPYQAGTVYVVCNGPQ